MKYLRRSVPFAAVSLPALAWAATTTDLKGVISLMAGYLNDILALLMGVAVVIFIYHVIKFFIIKSDAEHKEASQYIMWSLIGFFVILSFWGLVNILISTFSFGGTTPSWSTFSSIFPQ